MTRSRSSAAVVARGLLTDEEVDAAEAEVDAVMAGIGDGLLEPVPGASPVSGASAQPLARHRFRRRRRPR